MRVLQELKGEIRPLECIVMQASVPDCKGDPFTKKDSGGMQEWEAHHCWVSLDLAQPQINLEGI